MRIPNYEQNLYWYYLRFLRVPSFNFYHNKNNRLHLKFKFSRKQFLKMFFSYSHNTPKYLAPCKFHIDCYFFLKEMGFSPCLKKPILNNEDVLLLSQKKELFFPTKGFSRQLYYLKKSGMVFSRLPHLRVNS